MREVDVNQWKVNYLWRLKCLTEEENILVNQLGAPMELPKNPALIETLIDKYNIDILQNTTQGKSDILH